MEIDQNCHFMTTPILKPYTQTDIDWACFVIYLKIINIL